MVIVLQKHKLIIMVGVPGSGKSFKGTQIAEDNDFVYVSRDFVRNMLDLDFSKGAQAIAKKVFLAIIEASLSQGKTVVADATHLSVGSRLPLLELGQRYGTENIAIVMDICYETCILRNSARDEGEIVPLEAMRGMKKALSIPTKQEGWTVYKYTEGEEEKWDS